jgi:anaerobic C4-dicarboxylate transporter
MHFVFQTSLAFPFLDFDRAGRVSIGIYKGLNFQSFVPGVFALILSCYLLLSLKTSGDGQA